MPEDIRLHVRDLTYRLGGQAVLKGVNLSLAGGRLTVILGPNGAGKSTLLELLAGVRKTEQVYWGKRRLIDIPLMELACMRAYLGTLAERAFAFPVVELVEMGRNPWRARETAETLRVAVNSALARFDLAALAERKVTTLSSGEYQRVQLARVWAQMAGVEGEKPSWLLADEPLTHLDPRHQHGLLQVLRELVAGEGVGAVIVLHDVSLTSLFADDVILMKEGEIVAAGPVGEVLTGGNLTAVYGQPYEQTVSDSGRVSWVPI